MNLFAEEWLGRLRSYSIDSYLEPLSLRLEKRLILFRWICIAAFLAFLFIYRMPLDRWVPGLGVTALVVWYNLRVHLVLSRNPQWIARHTITVYIDAALILVLLLLFQKLNSPYYASFYLIIIVAGLRVGYRPAILIAVVLIFIGILPNILPGRPVVKLLDDKVMQLLIVRGVFLLGSAILSAYLFNQMKHLTTDLRSKLDQIDRLQQATLSLDASLDLPALLQCFVNEIAALSGGNFVLLQTIEPFEREVYTATSLSPSPLLPLKRSNLAWRRSLPVEALPPGLTELCQEAINDLINPFAPADIAPMSLMQQPLPQHRGTLLLMPIPLHYTVIAGLAIVDLHQRRTSEILLSLLKTFVSRAVLIIEKAELFRQLRLRTQELEHSNTELFQAYEDLRQLDEMKTTFLANVSHELRTPLTSIRSFAEILLDYPEDTLASREFLTIINKESERLTRLVNDLLDIAKIAQGKMEWEVTTVNVTALAWNVVRGMSALAEQQGLTLNADIPEFSLYVEGDPDRLTQVLTNLVGNALKFTLVGSITVRVRASGDQVLLQVEDTGVGIPGEELERVFEKFHQVGRQKEGKPKGTGLGLSISRDIIEHYHGHIWAERAAQGGTIMNCTLTQSPSEQILQVRAKSFLKTITPTEQDT